MCIHIFYTSCWTDIENKCTYTCVRDRKYLIVIFFERVALLLLCTDQQSQAQLKPRLVILMLELYFKFLIKAQYKHTCSID